MKKIALMYALVAAVGIIGMLLPQVFLYRAESVMLRERVPVSSEKKEVLSVSDIDLSINDEASEGSDSTYKNTEKDLYYSLIMLSRFKMLQAKGMVFEDELLKSNSELVSVFYNVLKDFDGIAGTNLAEKMVRASADASENNMIILSYCGMYYEQSNGWNKLRYYHVIAVYNFNDDDEHTIEVIFDADTKKIYSISGSIYTKTNANDIVNNYREYLQIPNNKYENYNESYDVRNGTFTDGAFCINLYNDYGWFSLSADVTDMEPVAEPEKTAVPSRASVGGK